MQKFSNLEEKHEKVFESILDIFDSFERVRKIFCVTSKECIGKILKNHSNFKKIFNTKLRNLRDKKNIEK